MTVGENVAYGLLVRKVPKAERDASRRRCARAWSASRATTGASPRQLSGRPAPARRPRPRPRQPAPRAAARRAARRPRPQAARGDADRAAPDPARRRDHVHLRDPRPGRGAHDEPPDRGVQRGPHRAGRRARGGLRAPGHGVRRRLRRHLEPARRGRRPWRSSGTTGTFTVRPEKIRLEDTEGVAADAAVPDDSYAAAGRIRSVVYLGPDTRYHVALDAGGELVVTQQNLATTSTEVLAAARARGAPRLETAAHPGDRRGVGLGVRHWRRSTDHAQTHPDPGGRGRPGRISVFERRDGDPGRQLGRERGAHDGSHRGRRASPPPRAPPWRRAEAAASFPTGEYGTIKPLKPAVDLSTVGGAGEGALNLIIWGGYAENGQNVPEYDWVTAFEAETGCKVNTKVGNTSDEMVTLMRQGGTYDGVSASGDATGRLIANGDVAAIDPATIPGFGDVAPFLQNAPHYVVDGKHYGTPHGWGGNTLLFRTDSVTPAPTSWNVVFDPTAAAPYAGQDHGLRQPDLHRRRRPVPQGAQPGARHHRSLRADPAAVRRGRGAAQAAASVGGQVLVPVLGRDRQLHQRHDHRRDDVAVPVQRARRRRRAGRPGRPLRGHDRVGGHVDDVVQGAAPELHAQVDDLDADARGPDAGRRVLRRGAGQPQGVQVPRRRPTARTGSRTSATCSGSTTRASTTRSGSGRRRWRTAATTAARRASTTRSGPRSGRRSRAEPDPRPGPGGGRSPVTPDAPVAMTRSRLRSAAAEPAAAPLRVHLPAPLAAGRAAAHAAAGLVRPASTSARSSCCSSRRSGTSTR